MAKENKKYIYYIGKDFGFAKTLRERYKKYEYIDGIEFVPYVNFEPEDYQKIFCELVDKEVRVIFLDFTTNSDEFVTLANLIKRDFHFASASLTILIDSNKLLPQTRQTTADFVHLKHGEHYDVAYDAVLKAFPKVVHKLDFACAKFKQDARLRQDVIVSYITPSGAYIETDAEFKESEAFDLDHSIPHSVLPSKKCIVKKVRTSNLVYDLKYGYEIAFQIVDEPTFTLEEEEDENFKQIKESRFKEHNELLIWQKKKFKSWVEDQASFSASGYKIRILIFDEFLSLFRHGEETSKKFPFSVRFQSSLDGSLNDVSRYRPEIVTMQFDPIEIEGAEDEEKSDGNDSDSANSSFEKLTELMKFIKETDGYKPYVVIFNTRNYDSQTLQNTYKYPFILVNKEHLNYPFLQNISQLLRKKNDEKHDKAIKAKVIELRKSDPKKYARLSEADLRDIKFYVDKRKEFAHAFVWEPIKIFELTESEISFVSEKELVIGSRYGVDFPMPMHVTLVPTELKKPDGIGNTWVVYHGLLSCLHELQKQELRQFVNKIFFADLDEKKAQEAQEVERIKQEALQRKLAAENSIEDDEATDE